MVYVTIMIKNNIIVCFLTGTDNNGCGGEC